MIELYPELFEAEEGASIRNAVYREEIASYEADVEFNDDAPHRFQRSLRVVIPRKAGTFCVHPKMMVLDFASYVRLVISSFNMSERQWEKAGDVFWWADLTLSDRPDPHLKRVGREPNLHAPLHDFLCSIGGLEAATLLDRADWRSLHSCHGRSTGIHAVASLPGEHHDKRFGQRRLGDILKHLPRFPRTGCPVRIQAWSIGGSAPIWYNSFVSTLTQDFQQSHDKHKTPLSTENIQIIVQTPRKGHCRSFDERMVTRGCLWEDKAHPLVQDEVENQAADSTVDWGWHSKVMCRFYPPQTCRNYPVCNRVHGWAYVGSHNLSASSWGALGPRGKISIRNYEMGVIITSLPAARNGFQCGICLIEAVPIPWSSISSLVPYLPTPEFVEASVLGVITFAGVVCNRSTIPDFPADCVPVLATPIQFPHLDSASDEDEDDDDDNEDAKQERLDKKDENVQKKQPFLFRLPIQKRGSQKWPPPPGTEVAFDVSERFGIVHIY